MWTPSHSDPRSEVPISSFHGIIHCRNITEPYMPDRVMRQFGYTQGIPASPLPPKRRRRSGSAHKYVCQHDPMIGIWNGWSNHCYNFGKTSPRMRCLYYTSGEYMQWYTERTRLVVYGKKHSDFDGEMATMEPTAQWVPAQFVPFHPDVRTSDDWVVLDRVFRQLEHLMPQDLLGVGRRQRKNFESYEGGHHSRGHHSRGHGI